MSLRHRHERPKDHEQATGRPMVLLGIDECRAAGTRDEEQACRLSVDINSRDIGLPLLSRHSWCHSYDALAALINNLVFSASIPIPPPFVVRILGFVPLKVALRRAQYCQLVIPGRIKVMYLISHNRNAWLGSVLKGVSCWQHQTLLGLLYIVWSTSLQTT